MKSGKSQLVAIILVALIAFGFGFGGGYAALWLSGSETGVGNAINNFLGLNKEAEPEEPPVVAASAAQNITITSTEDVSVAEAIAAKVLPSVVGISTVSEVSYSGGGFFWGFGNNGGYSYDVEGVGTGVIVDEAGYILTNSHVVNDGDTKSITVSLYDGQSVEGTVIWNDATLDLAVVKVDVEGLTAAELGDSDDVNIGSYAAAIGNPLGLDFERSMSQGIISGLDRTITVSDSSSSSGTTMEGLLQTDATINSGNSGGPLLNKKGEVIGINSAKAGDGEGMGFAIPINVAKPIVAQVKATGNFIRPYIGISGIGLGSQNQYNSQQLIEMFGTDYGVYVSSVARGGGAEKAGIQADDVIIALGDTKITTMNKLNSLLIKYAPGDSVELTVMRKGEELKCTVVLTDGNLTF